VVKNHTTMPCKAGDDIACPDQPSHRQLHKARSGRTTWAVLAFLLMFAILIVCVSEFYLLPALAAFKDANAAERLRLVAYSRLLLAIVLFILIVGLMLTFNIGRFFFPRPRSPKVQTKYVDAWAEAGRRAETPPTDSKE
jgi:hypothetical protein